jgi:hydrogenase maturation protease
MVEKIANAVLYEGYMLYPYRPSAVKNQQRFNFGALYPESYSRAGGGTDACVMQTECLVVGTERTTLDVKVRCLHLMAREVGVPIADCGFRIADWTDESQVSLADAEIRMVGSLEVGGRLFQTWQEAVEREVKLSSLHLSELVAEPQRETFTFPSSRKLEALRDESGQVAGVLVRTQQAIECAIEMSAQCIGDNLFKLTVHISNPTLFEDAKLKSRDEALLRALASTHTILNVRDGEFVSLLDPPETFREAVAACENKGTWPVLVGEEGARRCVLSSPIILYDYPQIAPESAGDLFDGTEIDEILTLRIMTLTDEEKREMRGADERARQILERTETLPVEQLMKLHGTLRRKN